MEPAEHTVRVLVEIPKGSRNKYEFDPDTGAIEFDRRLFAAVSYPTEYGFVLETLAPDGDELDALVCVTEPTFPGCVIPAKPIALLRMDDGDTPNHKVLCVPLHDPAWNGLEGLDDLPGDLQDEITHFFSVYTDIEGKEWRIHGWAPRDAALAEVAAARDRHFAEHGAGGSGDGGSGGG